jgi:glycine hydroxymethyltransferase
MKDKRIKDLIEKESKRQKSVINLVASENYISDDVKEALSSDFTNKYAEGYPGKRYYGGVNIVDEIEVETQNRALKLFGLNQNRWEVNVQALSGTPAVIASILAVAKPGDTILSMDFSSGGHLSHGHPLSIIGKLFTIVQYKPFKESGGFHEEEIRKLAKKHKPAIILAGYSAYPRLVPFKMFSGIAKEVGATMIGDISHVAGLIAGGAYPSPFRYCDIVVTTTHKTLRGPRAALIFSRKDKRDLPKHINRSVFPGIQGGAHYNTIAGVAVALGEADTKSFKKYSHQVIKNAKIMAETFQKTGWKVSMGGTDSHLFLLDVKESLGIDGNKAQEILEENGIIVNKNLLSGDLGTAQKPSGIRIGTAAETTRGKKENDFEKIAKKINKIMRDSIQ